MLVSVKRMQGHVLRGHAHCGVRGLLQAYSAGAKSVTFTCTSDGKETAGVFDNAEFTDAMLSYKRLLGVWLRWAVASDSSRSRIEAVNGPFGWGDRMVCVLRRGGFAPLDAHTSRFA